MTTESVPSRTRGGLLGHLAGDALGRLAECRDAGSMPKLHRNGVRERGKAEVPQSDTGHLQARRRSE